MKKPIGLSVDTRNGVYNILIDPDHLEMGKLSHRVILDTDQQINNFLAIAHWIKLDYDAKNKSDKEGFSL